MRRIMIVQSILILSLYNLRTCRKATLDRQFKEQILVIIPFRFFPTKKAGENIPTQPAQQLNIKKGKYKVLI